MWWRSAFLVFGFALGCDKVPVTDVVARFSLADASWFAEEQTLFVFYRVDAEQGLDQESVVELRYVTDDEVVDWTDVNALISVHDHAVVTCGDGVTSLCGSASVAVTEEPRELELRLRYRRDSPLELPSSVTFNSVAAGNRSALVYGVFDQSNRAVQWRIRHVFPTLRNEEITELGLRRAFTIDRQVHGTLVAGDFEDSPYGYGFAAACPAGFSPVAGTAPVSTLERAVFEPAALGEDIAESSVICSRATVFDALGPFESTAVARKNPEVRPAFPTLRTPIVEAREVGYLMRFCDREISAEHRDMKIQRWQLGGEPVICLDDWMLPSFTDATTDRITERLADRGDGNDVVLKLALHHDVQNGALQETVEEVLVRILVPESAASSPRVVGAIVYDSFGYQLSRVELSRLVLWCPSLDEEVADGECAVQPDVPEVTLGPLGFSGVAILPTRRQYLDFIDSFSEAQAGEVTALQVLAPERTPTSENVPVGDFAVATFFNQEVLTVPADASFSTCSNPLLQQVVFRTARDLTPSVTADLPFYHEVNRETVYEVGLLWDFPFLLRMDYRSVGAGRINAFSISVPFGVGVDNQTFIGATQWQQEEFALGDDLLVCTRFCDHPTFGPSGVYEVNLPFDPTYVAQCYRPRFPSPGDGGFPRDP
ncbi:MAG: hypothetical protein AAFX94_04065 [Myxococcota bacterium]